MMNSWYSCSIKYERLDESGKLIVVQEQVLVNAVNFTDAETKIIEYKSKDISGQFYITKISVDNLEEIVYSADPDYWFKAKVILVDTIESGKEKKYIKTFYVSGHNFELAVSGLREHLKECYITDAYINSMTLTKVTDIIQ